MKLKAIKYTSFNSYDAVMTQEEWKHRFAANLRAIMFDKNITQKELLNDVGFTQSQLSMYMNGKTVPSAINVLNIAHALGVTIDELIDFGSSIE